MNSYTLLDSGDGKKCERFGDYIIVRPAPMALWKPEDPELWKKADAEFTRQDQGEWIKKKLPPTWTIKHQDITFKLSATEFGHLGFFPEHSMFWKTDVKPLYIDANILNLFAYSGGATLFCAKMGAKVCHLDAAKGMIDWAKENAKLNQLEKAPIRWIVDDAIKFVRREVKRGAKYDGIILDPPSFGRGKQGQVFKIERDLPELLDLCRALLSENPRFLLLTAHTPGMTQTTVRHLLTQMMHEGEIVSGEMLLEGKNCFPLPSGAFARWTP